MWPARNKFGLYDPVSLILTAAIGLCILIVYIAHSKKFRQEVDGLKPRTEIVLFVCLLIFQLIIARALESSGYNWDSQVALNAAASYAFTGHLTAYATHYFALNPNNIPLLCGLGALFGFLHRLGLDDFLTAASLLSAVLLWCAQLLTYLAADLLYGKRFALITLIFTFILINCSPQVATIYTDTLALVFPVAILYFSLRLARAQRLVTRAAFSAVIGFVAMIGILLKPTVAIALIAVALTGLLWLLSAKQPWSKRGAVAASVVPLVIAMGLTYFGFQSAENAMRILPFPAASANAGGPPPAHFVAIGMQTTQYNNRTEYGGYDRKQAEAMASLPTLAQRNDYSIQSIKHTLSSYGPLGYLRFLALKMNWILSDATFYAYGEGTNDQVVFADHSRLAGAIRSFLFVGGRNYSLLGNTSQVFWLALLLLIGAQAVLTWVRGKVLLRLEVTLLRLMVAGNILFVLIFEGRSRYLYLYVPCFVVLSLYLIKVLVDESGTVKSSTSRTRHATRHLAGQAG